MSDRAVVLHAYAGNYEARLVTLEDDDFAFEEDLVDGEHVIGDVLERRKLGDAGLVADVRAARWAKKLGVPYLG